MKTINLLSVLTVFSCFTLIAFAAQQSDADKSTLQATVSFYQKSKTLRELIRNSPDFGPYAEAIQSDLFKQEMDKPLQKVSFDYIHKTLTIGHIEVEFLDLSKGLIKIDGHDYAFDKTLNYYENLEKILELVSLKKSASLMNLLITEARAQNRDEFPLNPGSDYRGKDWAKVTSKVGSQGYVIYTGIRTAITKIGLPLVSIINTVAIAASYAVNKSHAYAAPSCANQVKKLKQVMNQGHISLSKFKCGKTALPGFESTANISFWTPDKQELPFFANWESSEAYVDNGVEVYHFERDKLSKVEFNGIDEREITAGKKFKTYQIRLEPYRQVFHEVGINNSCHKCEAEFNNSLIHQKPIVYSASDSKADTSPKSSTRTVNSDR